MADREDYYSDEFDSCEDDVQDEKEIKPKRSKASPRPKSAFKKTAKKAGKADGYRSRPASVPASKATSRDMWLNAVKSGGPTKNKGHMGKRSTAEYWTDTLRKTGFGISTESGANGMTNLRKTQGMAYSSTSHYLRQIAGLEKARKVASEPTAKAATRVPAYKEPEEYYDDILALKKQMMLISTENSTLKTKLRRLEEDNLKKAEEIKQLLDPSKGEELRKTLGDRKPDAGTMIQSLKQKMLKLEHQLREKETAFNKLQGDLKTTKIEEMKLQMEQFYREVVRLSQLKNTTTNGHRNEKTLRENPSKLKALQETILRLNEKNLTLTNENKTLKQDLQALMDDRDTANENEKEYRDMSKRELLATISKLEKKVDRGEVETMSVTSDVSHRRKEKEGKLSLQGTMAQRFDQLDKRETELLEDIEKQRGLTKKMKDDRAHYRKKCEDKEHRSSVRKTSRSSSVTSLENEKQLRVEEFRKQVAAQHIQRQWKQRKSKKEHEEEEKRIRSFQEKRAARCIQGAWHDHRRDVEGRDRTTSRAAAFCTLQLVDQTKCRATVILTVQLT
ncbi:hypothetical protein LSAT2_015937 [Lamellibrachia satsuma]|nr:hypothetical protein LSAT2_015937 [Lamellibrachia satsuma]